MATYPFIPYPSDEEWATLDVYQPTFRDFNNTPFLLIGVLNDTSPRPGTPVYGNARAQIRMSSKRGPILEYPAKLVDDAGRPFCIVDIPHYCEDDADTLSIPKCNLFSALDPDIPRKFYNPNTLTATTTLWSIIAGLLEANEKDVRFSLRCEMQNRYPPPPGIASRKPSALPESRKASVLAIPSPIEEVHSALPTPPPEELPEPEPETVALCQCGNPLPPSQAKPPSPQPPTRAASITQGPPPARTLSNASVSPRSLIPSALPSAQPSRYASVASIKPISRQPSMRPPSRQPTTSPEPVPSRRPSVLPEPIMSRQPTFVPDQVPSRRQSVAPEPVVSRQPSVAPQLPSRNASVVSMRPPPSLPVSPRQPAPEPDVPPTFSSMLQDPAPRRKKVPGHGTSPALAPSISTESDYSEVEPPVPPAPPTPPPLPPVSAPAAPIHPRVSIIPPLMLGSRQPTLVGSPSAPPVDAPLTEPAFPSPPRIGRVPTILSKLNDQPAFSLNPVPNRRASATPAKKLPNVDRNPPDRPSPLDDLRSAMRNRRLSHRQRNVNDETMTIMTEALAALEQSTKSALDVNDRMDDERAMEVNQEVARDLEDAKQRFGEDLVGAMRKLNDGEDW